VVEHNGLPSGGWKRPEWLVRAEVSPTFSTTTEGVRPVEDGAC